LINPQVGVATNFLRGGKAVCFKGERRLPVDVEDKNGKRTGSVRSLRWFAG
jgi:hypothetical protein